MLPSPAHLPRRPVIIGLGNRLMGDDGVGPFVISLLQKELADTDLAGQVEMFTLETPGYSLLSYISLQDFVILVDAARFGGYPGEVKRFTLENMPVSAANNHAELDLHSSDLFKVCRYAQQLDLAPKQLIFFAIQLVSVTPSCALSPAVRSGAHEVALLIKEELSIIKSNT